MQVKVIPTLSWAEDASFQFCFDGIEPGGVVNKKTGAKLKSITYYDNSLKRSKQIDLDHPHQGENPHTHLGYIHDEYGTRKLTTKEKRLVAFVYRTWDNRIAKHGVG